MDVCWCLCPSKHIKLLSVVFDICLLPSHPTHLWLSLKPQLRECYKQLPSPGCGMTRPLAAQLVADICWPDSVVFELFNTQSKPETERQWLKHDDHKNMGSHPGSYKQRFGPMSDEIGICFIWPKRYMFSSAKLCKHATFRHLKRQQHSTTFTRRHVVSAAASHLMVVFATCRPWWAVSLGRYVNLLTVHGTCTKKIQRQWTRHHMTWKDTPICYEYVNRSGYVPRWTWFNDSSGDVDLPWYNGHTKIYSSWSREVSSSQPMHPCAFHGPFWNGDTCQEHPTKSVTATLLSQDRVKIRNR